MAENKASRDCRLPASLVLYYIGHDPVKPLKEAATHSQQ